MQGVSGGTGALALAEALAVGCGTDEATSSPTPGRPTGLSAFDEHAENSNAVAVARKRTGALYPNSRSRERLLPYGVTTAAINRCSSSSSPIPSSSATAPRRILSAG